MDRRILTILPALLILATIAAGCSSNDDARLVALAMESSDRQADQNRQMADLQKEVATGTKELVTADAAARQEMASLSRELQKERSEVGRQRDDLETQRKQIAERRHRDPLLAAAITHAAWIVACLLPLLVCLYLLRRPDDAADDGLVAEVLIEDCLSDEPVLLTRNSPARLLTGPHAPDAEDGRDTCAPSD